MPAHNSKATAPPGAVGFEYLHPRADEILDRLVEVSLCRICKDPGMPNKRTVLRWTEKNEEFAKAYFAALELAGHSAADDERYVGEEMMAGNIAADVGRAVQQGHRWQAACRVPKMYGNKVQAEHSGGVNVQVVTGVPSPTD